jgi:hypothetical protein
MGANYVFLIILDHVQVRMQLLRQLNENHHQIRLQTTKKNHLVQGSELKIFELFNYSYNFCFIKDLRTMVRIENIQNEKLENE